VDKHDGGQREKPFVHLKQPVSLMLPLTKRNENYFTAIGMVSIMLFVFLSSIFAAPLVLKIMGLSRINGTTLFISRMFYWIGLAGLCWYSKNVEKQNVLIWEDRPYKASTYIAFIVVLFVILFAGVAIIQILYSFTHLNKTSSRLVELADIFRRNKSLLIFTALTAGVTEEIIFRGYLQPRLEKIFRNPYAAILISSFLFGLIHFGYGTVINMIVPFFIGLVFACFYWKYRNIKLLIIFHFLWDLLSLYSLIRHH
jgi:membrane protease YdiL (CAAX protease family)